MKTATIALLFICANLTAIAQTPYYEELTPMPEAATNNAVTAATVNGTPFVYSFAGLDSTKIWSGINLKAWRMNAITGEWQTLPPVPDPAGGKIAAAASTVKNRIYVIGGYHVAQNGSETSSDKVHRFDPETNTWLSDGASLPKPVDDHVQAVWRDSLIFVVTGWSNIGNVPDVQIYNPSTDTWTAGTAVPNNLNYKVFGASGVIIGDTIYYCGGAAAGINFPASSFFRKGYINPENPAEIDWSGYSTQAAKGYRMAAGIMAASVAWIGGSDVTYNYNGMAYDGSGGVPALRRRKQYYFWTGKLFENAVDSLYMPAIMDLRGTAQINGGYFITAGGMEPGQKVSRQVFGFNWAVPVSVQDNPDMEAFSIFPNPASNSVTVACKNTEPLQADLFNLQGQKVKTVSGFCPFQIPTGDLPAATYWIKILAADKSISLKKVIINR